LLLAKYKFLTRFVKLRVLHLCFSERQILAMQPRRALLGFSNRMRPSCCNAHAHGD